LVAVLKHFVFDMFKSHISIEEEKAVVQRYQREWHLSVFDDYMKSFWSESLDMTISLSGDKTAEICFMSTAYLL